MRRKGIRSMKKAMADPVGATKFVYRRLRKRVNSSVRRLLGAWRGKYRPSAQPELQTSIPSLDGALIRSEVVPRLEEFAKNLREIDRYYLAERLTYAVYPKYRFSDFSRIYLEDEEFTRYYERFMPPGNWRTFDRKFFLRELLKLVKSVGGDLAECGTYCIRARRHT
jgi:hypothetical protein